MGQILSSTVLLLVASTLLLGAELPDHALTLREALELARARNASLASARAHAEAVQANEITAGLRPNPVITSANEDFNVFHLSRSDIQANQEFTQSILQTIERGQKRQRRVESARWATKVAQDTYRDTQRQLEFAVKSSFVAMLLAKSVVQLASENLRDYQETVRLNEIRLKAGEISLTDLDRIRVEQARFETDLLNAQLALQQARVQLESLLGLPNLPVKFDIQGELTAPQLSLSLDQLQQMALENRPDYLAARDGVSRAEVDVRLADANGSTDLSLGGEYKRNGIDNTIGFTVQIPLRIFDRNQGEKLRTRHELDASRSSEAATRVAVLADVAQAYEAYRSAFQRAQLYSRDYTERARQVRDRIAFSYRNGATSLLDYLDALRSYRDVEFASRSAYAQAMTNVHQLSLVTGTELLP